MIGFVNVSAILQQEDITLSERYALLRFKNSEKENILEIFKRNYCIVYEKYPCLMSFDETGTLVEKITETIHFLGIPLLCRSSYKPDYGIKIEKFNDDFFLKIKLYDRHMNPNAGNILLLEYLKKEVD